MTVILIEDNPFFIVMFIRCILIDVYYYTNMCTYKQYKINIEIAPDMSRCSYTIFRDYELLK